MFKFVFFIDISNLNFDNMTYGIVKFKWINTI